MGLAPTHSQCLVQTCVFLLAVGGSTLRTGRSGRDGDQYVIVYRCQALVSYERASDTFSAPTLVQPIRLGREVLSFAILAGERGLLSLRFGPCPFRAIPLYTADVHIVR